MLPIMYCCSKKSFIGICGKIKNSGYLLQVTLSLFTFFLVRHVPILSIYVIFPHFFLCFQSHLRHWGQQEELWIPSYVSEAGPVATPVARCLPSIGIILQVPLVIQVATGAYEWALASCYQICFCYSLDNSHGH